MAERNLNYYVYRRCERCKEPESCRDGFNVYCNHAKKLKHRYVKVEVTVDADSGVNVSEKVIL